MAKFLTMMTAMGVLIAAAPVGAASQTQTPAGPAVVAADPAAVAALAATLNGVLDAQAPKASTDDIEAALIFAIDQSQQPKVVILAALDALDVTRRTNNAKSAVARLRRKIAAEVGLPGTGGIGANGTGLGSGPSVGGGANGTDYTGGP